MLNGFSFFSYFFILGRAVDYAGLTASFRAHVNIASLLIKEPKNVHARMSAGSEHMSCWIIIRRIVGVKTTLVRTINHHGCMMCR